MKKALVLTLAFALGLGIAAFAAPLSGSWNSTIGFDITGGGTISVSSFTSDVVVDYTVGGWTFESTTGFELDGWTTQEFTANGVLGAFTVGSDLVFDPTGPSFTYWDTTGSVSIAGVSFNGEFLLNGTGGAGWTFGATGSAGDLSLGANVYFNSELTSSGLVLVQTDSACFCFTSVSFDVSFPFACIDLVDISLGFSTAGFDGVTFSVTGIAVPGIAWLTFDADLTFTTTSKTLELTPEINLGDFTCITLYYELVYGEESGYQINGIDFYALGLSYTWNGVTFSDLSIFDVDKYIANIDPYWDPAYWEVFSISSAADSCCGGGFDFSIDTYFQDAGTTLFDWGETDVSLSYGIGSNFTVSTGLTVDTSGFTALSLGFEVTW